MSNPFGPNPYEPPNPTPNPFAGPMDTTVPRPTSPGMVGQVRILAILMFVQAVLELMMGFLLLVMAAVMPTIMSQGMRGAPAVAPPNNISPAAMNWILLGLYGGMGITHCILAVVRWCAAYRLYQFKSRIFAVVTLASGVITLFSCYCSLTSIGLAIYGLIVLLNEPVAAAFRMRAAGHTPEEVLQAFR